MSDVERVARESETVVGKGSQEPLTREQLYELVWTQPMLRIGEKVGVSSSYLARVCTDLRVPRPPRGYWTQREFDKAPAERPALPPVRPGDATVWSPGTTLTSLRPQVVRPAADVRPTRRLHKSADELHELLVGVKSHFLKTRKSEVGLLRPFKRLLVDIVTSEKQLDVLLGAANCIFHALEARGHRVTFAPPNSGMRRAEVDEREAPDKNRYHDGIWSPDRVTVVYVGSVPIGLTLFETTEEVEVIYVDGTYIPVSELNAMQLRRYQGPMHWKTKESRASGRFCLQAYCPRMVAWTKQWRAASGKEMSALIPKLIEELEATAPILANQVADAEARAEVQRREWEEESRRRREEQERARQAKLRQEAKDDLLAAIDVWDRARRVQEWLALVEREVQDLAEVDRQQVLSRLEQARALVGGADALELLKKWRGPGERQ